MIDPIMKDGITTFAFPPLKGQQCPFCMFGRINGGFTMSSPDKDGSCVMQIDRGMVCGVCKGKGRVYITYTPIED